MDNQVYTIELPSPGPPPRDSDPPPYEEPPPSYESLYGNLKAAKQDSSGFVDFMKKVAVIVFGTIGCTICVGIVLAIPISMIVMGSIYIDDCPAEEYIPIYLIVAGVFGIIKNISSMLQRIKNKVQDEDEENAKTNPFDAVLSCFLFAWFIAGNVWIYSLYGDWSDNDKDPNYCHPTLYWFAFWMTTASYIIAGVGICGCCLLGIFGVFCCPDDDS